MDRAAAPILPHRVHRRIRNDEFWQGFRDELSNVDPDLLFFPQRRFEFKSLGAVVVPQLADSVGSTVWDAEVFLAHYVDKCINFEENSIVVELGAGTGIAGILLSLQGNKYKVIVQELAEVINHTLRCFSDNNSKPFYAAVGLWGTELIESILSSTERQQVDCILMADVLYHKEHFADLAKTIAHILKFQTGQLIMVFEQRRKDLSPVVNELVELFEVCEYEVHTIPRRMEGEDNIHVEMSIFHFKGFKGLF